MKHMQPHSTARSGSVPNAGMSALSSRPCSLAPSLPLAEDLELPSPAPPPPSEPAPAGTSLYKISPLLTYRHRHSWLNAPKQTPNGCRRM
jgi:hypothetical protein